MGYTTVDAYATLNRHLKGMNLFRICFDCNVHAINTLDGSLPNSGVLVIAAA